MRQNIGDVAIELMKREQSTVVGFNEFGLLDDIFAEARLRGIVKEAGSRGGRNNPHPINRQTAVLNSLDRDKRFKKFYIRCQDRIRGREVLVREFKLV